MYSSRRTEDDSVSYTSGPPIPPPRSRYAGNGPARFVKVCVATRGITYFLIRRKYIEFL